MFFRRLKQPSSAQNERLASFLQLATHHYCPSLDRVMWKCAVFLSQRARRLIDIMAYGFFFFFFKPSAFTHWNLKQLKCKGKQKKWGHILSRRTFLKQSWRGDRRLLLLMVTPFEKFSTRDGWWQVFFTDPGSGFVGGGGQEQGGGCSFQVWQRDRHMSVD